MEQIIYDAFISYSHSEPDSYVAEKLHFMLEHYHISRKIQEISGKKRIERVFRDREELPLSSDLAANIRQALENSEYLIVICSPRAVRSEWVQREIDVFLETHEKDKVLTLLVDGEPEDAFPEVLCYNEEKIIDEDGEEKIIKKKVEPMAADVRGGTRKEVEKKLKEEFLRILAPMLSCTYDMLRQRHREYLFKRIIALTGAAAALAVLFTIFAFHQASVSEKRYQEARRNQARYLSEISGELLAGGDREGALQTALAIRPEDEDADSPVVPEQMYALNNALYSYDKTNKIRYRPAYSTKLDGQIMGSYGADCSRLSPEETGYFCVDLLGNAYVLNPSDGECIWRISPEEIEGLEDDGFSDFLPVSEETAVLISSKSIVYVNWQEKNVNRIIQSEEDFTRGSNTVTVWNTRIALTNGDKVWVYDLETGKSLQEVQYGGDEYQSYNPKSLSFSEDGNMLAIGVSVDHYDVEPQKGLMVLSVNDGSIRMLSELETEKVLFLGNEAAAAVQYQYPDREEASETAPKRSFSVTVYNMENGEPLWTSASYDTQAMNNPCGLSVENMEVNGEMQDVAVAAVKDRVFILEPETGEILQDRRYPNNISGIYKFDDTRFLIGLENGSIRLCTIEQMSTEFEAGSISANTFGFVFSRKNNTVIWPVTGSRQIVIGGMFQDDNMVELSMEAKISDVQYHTVQGGQDGEDIVYRCVFYNEDGGISAAGVKVYQAGSTEQIFEYRCESDSQWIGDTNIQNIDGSPYILMYLSGGTGQFIMADLKTGEITKTGETVSESENETYSAWRHPSYCFFHTAEKVLVYSYGSFMLADLTDKGLEMPDPKTESIPCGSVYDTVISADDRYIIFTVSDEMKGIKIWDIKNETWVKIEGKQVYLSEEEICVGNESGKAAIYSTNGTIDIIDLEDGQIIQSLPCGYYGRICLAFMNHDRYLLSSGDNSILTMWDVETGEILMQDEDNDTYVSEICTDGNEHYFATGFYGYVMNDDGMQSSSLHVYYVDDAGRFYPYADISDGYVSFAADEIFTADSGGCFARIYTYGDLGGRAEKILDGQTLTDAEKRQYFISE